MGIQRTGSVLVTDLAGSTELRVRLGEAAWLAARAFVAGRPADVLAGAVRA